LHFSALERCQQPIARGDRLEALIRALLVAGGLTAGREVEEAQGLWDAVHRDSPRTHAPFDQALFAQLVSQRTTPGSPAAVRPDASSPLAATGRVGEPVALERRQDWGEAPDTTKFVGRTDELATLRRWLLDERCRLMVNLGMGGIGKTSLASKLAHEARVSVTKP
jgi:hypothetical protein